MKSRLFAFLCLSLAFALLRAETVSDNRLAEHLKAIALMGERREGSPAESALLSYIRRQSRGLGLKAEDQFFSGLPDAHSFSQSLVVQLPGARPETLILAVPLNTYPGEPEGKGDAAIALALSGIESLAASLAEGHRLPLRVAFAFLGAERGPSIGDPDSYVGSRRFISQLEPARPIAVLYLSCDDLPGSLELHNAGAQGVSPYWLYERVRRSLAASSFPYRLAPSLMQAYRVGLLKREGPIDTFLEARFPALELRGWPESAVTPASAQARFQEFLEALLLESSSGFPSEWDRNYLAFQVNGLSFVLREGLYVAMLFALLGAASLVLLGISILNRRSTKAFFRKLPLRVLSVLFLFAIAAAACRLAGSLTPLEGHFLGSPAAWSLSPGIAVAARIGVALFSFLAALSALIGLKAASPDPYFYEAVAACVIGLDILVFTALMPTFALYFLWAFIAACLSLLVRNRWASLGAGVAMTIPFALITGEFGPVSDTAFLGPLMTPTALESLVVAAGAFPYFCFAASLALGLAPRGRRARFAAAILGLVLAFIPEVGFIALRRDASLAVPVMLSESLDQDHGRMTLRLASRGRIGALRLLRGRDILAFKSSGDSAEMELPLERPLVSCSASDRPFLDRATWRIRIDFSRRPSAVSLRLESEQELRLYDCDFPYQVSLGGRSAEIFVGLNPPERLTLTLTADKALSARLLMEAEYPQPWTTTAIEGGRALVLERSLVRASFPVGEE